MLTAGGIIAQVTRVKEGVDEVEVEIAPNVRVNVLRATISDTFKPVAAEGEGGGCEELKTAPDRGSPAPPDPQALWPDFMPPEERNPSTFSQSTSLVRKLSR